jgi:hypothetical protein
MPSRPPYPDLLSEIASAVIFHTRAKNNISTSLDIGPAEEKAARERAARIIKAIHVSIMNRTLKPEVTDEEINELLDPRRNNADIIDLDGLQKLLRARANDDFARDYLGSVKDSSKKFAKTLNGIEQAMTL